jgi:hypothetical protein
MYSVNVPARLVLLLFLSTGLRASSFSLLSHEAIIDTTWNQSIRPLLLQKYPGSSEEQLKEAYAHVYGGAVMPDIGYYPFGSVMFSHLVHYVRTGDLCEELLRQAQNLNEYAFALGMLCHYNADRFGHPLGTNLVVPMLFPKTRAEHGDTVTYDEDHSTHVRTEFGFDVIQTARGSYKSDQYLQFIDFKVNEPVLERAFVVVYGLRLEEVFANLQLAVETFRYSVKELFPELTKDAWKSKQSVITKANPLATKDNYSYKMKNAKFREKFGMSKLRSTLLSAFIAITPKYGPLAGLDYKAPSDEAEKIYERSFNIIVDSFTFALNSLQTGTPQLGNINYDTGEETRPGEYRSADESYETLLRKLKHNKFRNLSPQLKQELLTFFSNPKAGQMYAKNPSHWKRITKRVNALRDQQPVSYTAGL